MNQVTYILHLEDDALDAELVQVTLESAGIVCQINRVQNRDEFTQALQQGGYDIILADYRLPAYDGVSALRLAQELRPDLPFIFVSGTLGEDAAIDGFTQGATDYVLKRKLARLAPAIERALHEAENQRMRQQAEAALQERVQQSQSLLRLSRRLERAQTYREVVNAALAEVRTIIGYQNLWVYLLTEDRQYYTALMADGEMSESVMTGEGIATLTIKGDPMLEEIAAARQIVIVDDARLDERTDKAIVARLGNRTIVNIPIILFDKHLGTVGTGTFGDEGVHAPTLSEQEYLTALASHMAVSLDRLHLSEQRQQTEAALRESETKFRAVFESSVDAIGVSKVGIHTFVNPAYLALFGYADNAELTGKPILDLIAPGHREQVLENVRRRASGLPAPAAYETRGLRKDGSEFDMDIHMSTYELNGEIYSVPIIRDITERKQAEEALRTTKILLEQTFEQSPVPMILVSMPDVILRYVNPASRRFLGIDDEPSVIDTPLMEMEISFQDFDLQGRPGTLEELPLVRSLKGFRTEGEERCILRKDGTIRYELVSGAPIFDDAGQIIAGYLIMMDITERKRAEARILRLNRLYATLSQINQTIVHVRDRETLFREICRVAVEHGQFRLALISLIDEATYRVKPVAFAGEEQGFLSLIGITYRDEPLGRGPTGTAIREGHCIICQDIATDPSMQLWRDAALQRGYRSSAAVPIRQDGRVVGALTVYATEPHSLDAEDQGLLDEIGLDISFALDTLEREMLRRQVEAELSELNAELEQRVIDRTVELARAHERLRAILDTAGEGVVFTDLQGTIEYINPAMERLTGYTAEEALGYNPRLWKSDQTPLTLHQRMWGALTRGEIWQGELVNRRKDGQLYDAALTTSPLTNPEGQIVGFVGVQRDISRQKELDRLKDQFVSNVSHELRTPLANVLLHIGLLEHGKPDKHDVYLQTLRREAERLRKMIEDLLDLSRLDRNVAPIQFMPTDLNQLLEQFVTDRAALTEQRRLTLTYEPAPDLPLILTDASKIIQVASNLLTNALNYTPAGGIVRVWAEVRQHEGQKMAAFTVRDTGPGITAQDLPHLFERFYRGAAGRRASAPGTGLGLAISHEIMERLGGRLTVESEAGHGAAFTVWLPLT